MIVVSFFENAYQYISKIYKSLKITNKQEEIYSLKEISKILYELVINENFEENAHKTIFNFFKNKAINKEKYEKMDEEEEICKDIKDLYKFLEKNIGKNENFPKLMSFILIDEFKQNKNSIYRKWII